METMVAIRDGSEDREDGQSKAARIGCTGATTRDLFSNLCLAVAI